MILANANVVPHRAGFKNDQTNLQVRSDGKMSGASLVGTVLARRYKILETIDVDSFKTHDLALDQAVTVRQPLLTSQRAGDTWRQKSIHSLCCEIRP
jgi:hypothetical protein